MSLRQKFGKKSIGVLVVLLVVSGITAGFLLNKNNQK